MNLSSTSGSDNIEELNGGPNDHQDLPIRERWDVSKGHVFPY
jgi:hypothetical protein